MTKGLTPPALEWLYRLDKLTKPESLLALRIVNDQYPQRFVARLDERHKLAVAGALINDWRIETITRYLGNDSDHETADIIKAGLAEVERLHA